MTLAIDLGTSNLKVGLINEGGEILSSCTAAIETISKESGAAEHDPEELKNLVLKLSGKVLENKRKDHVKYIIASTYHMGMMMMDEQKRPLTGITLLTDTRSQHSYPDFLSVYAADDLYSITGCPLISQYVLPRIFYYSRYKQGLYDKVKYFHDSKSFLFEWLTGEWITDISTASATQFFNIYHFQWDQDILSKINLSPDQFPPTGDGTEVMAPLRKEISELLGLNGSTQVVLGVYDGAVLGFGLSGLSTGAGIMNIGTTAMLRLPGQFPVFDKNENKRIQAYAINKKVFLNGGALNNAALPLDWMRSNLFDFDLQDERLLHFTGEPPLISLPYLTGERDSKTGPFASGIFFGVRREHSRIDFVRAVLEGVAYSMRFVYEALEENNMSSQEIHMGGGGANIKVWPQIFADVLGIPVWVPFEKEISLIGNSILAFTAGGIYKNIEEASENMVKTGRCIDPVENIVKIRNKHYEFFVKLRESLGPLYKEHAGLRC